MADNVSTESSGDVSEGGFGLSDVAQEALQQDAAAPPPPPAKKPAASQEAVSKAPKKQATPEPSEEEESDLLLADEEDEAPPSKVYELKANGKTYKVDSEEKLKAMAQRGIAIEQQYQKQKADFDKMRDEVERIRDDLQAQVKLAKEKPEDWFRKQHGDKAEEIAERLLIERAEEWALLEKMTPRERQLYQEKKQYQDKLKHVEESERQQAQAEETRLIEEQKSHLGNIFAKALSEYKLPANATTVRVMSSIYRAALQKGVELSTQQAADLTKQQLKQIADHSFSGVSPSDFVEMYPELANGIRKHFVSKAKSRAGELSDVPRQAKRKSAPSDVPDKGKEWDKYIEELKEKGRGDVLKARFGFGA